VLGGAVARVEAIRNKYKLSVRKSEEISWNTLTLLAEWIYKIEDGKA
jgi:hypothetical protein